MRLVRLLIAGLVIIPAATAGTIHPLKGDPFKAEIVSVTDDEITYQEGGAEKKLASDKVLKIEYRDVGKPARGEKFSRVELTDGSVLLASRVLLKKKMLEMMLLSGGVATVPIKAVHNILIPGQEWEKYQRDWEQRTYNARGKGKEGREGFVLNNDGIINLIDSTLGDGDETGEKIATATVIGEKVIQKDRVLAKDHGWIWKHVLDPKAPAYKFKLYDNRGNMLMVSSAKALKGGGLEVTTQAGAVLKFEEPRLATLDYTKGRLDRLSDLTPLSVEARSNLDEEEKPDHMHIFLNKSLVNKGISVGGVEYKKGLAIKPRTVVTYDLKGDYREFSMVVGLDDRVTASKAAVMTIMGDAKELSKVKIAPDDKVRFKALTLNIKDVQKLVITVEADDNFDTGTHLDLADAKVSK
jgi:hypothetical protein